jgi:hypothetical protein
LCRTGIKDSKLCRTGIKDSELCRTGIKDSEMQQLLLKSHVEQARCAQLHVRMQQQLFLMKGRYWLRAIVAFIEFVLYICCRKLVDCVLDNAKLQLHMQHSIMLLIHTAIM